jgi:hypothetical protein
MFNKKEYDKKWYLKNKENIRKHYLKNKEAKIEYQKKYNLKNRETKKEYDKQYKQKNKKAMRKYYREKKKNDLNFKLASNIRVRILMALKKNKKSQKTMKLLDCSISQLWDYLESKFEPGMTKENHGLYGWHIDHIKPCASFDLRCPVQQLACFHYSNLQPLWAKDNIKKGKKYEME